MDTFGTSTTRPPFEVTTAAVDQITALGAVRLSLAAGRCCGTTYVFTQVADERTPGVTRFGCAGAWLHVDTTPSTSSGGPVSTTPHRASRHASASSPTRTPHRYARAAARSGRKAWPGPRQPTCRAYAPMPWDEDYEPPADWARRTGFSRDEPGPG